MIEKLKITGSQVLNGRVSISGAKNAALPIIAASLLSPNKLKLSNVPLLTDVLTFLELLNNLGASSAMFFDNEEENLLNNEYDISDISNNNASDNNLNCQNQFAEDLYKNANMCHFNVNTLNKLHDKYLDFDKKIALLQNSSTQIPYQRYSVNLSLQASNISNTIAHYEIVKKMRASILVLGPLLARFGCCRVSLPGGCAIGVRPVDLHLKAMEALGATIEIENGYIYAYAKQKLKGTKFEFPIVTVTGTENLVMAAVLAEGTTIIGNAAMEPEIIDLCNCLNKMGAKIEGHGTQNIIVTGVTDLHEAEYSIISDRVEAFTYAAGAMITGGNIELVGQNLYSILEKPFEILLQIGAKITKTSDGILIKSDNLEAVDIETAPYPGFPTDMQAQIMSVLVTANGQSHIRENIWENRFMHVSELIRMGANISINGNTAIINGLGSGVKLKGAPVMATDLRASFSLVLAALAAEGTTVIDRIYHLKRGYSFMKEKMIDLGAEVDFFY